MAHFRRRSGGWQAEVATDGVRKAKTFPTKAQATAWAAKVEADIADGIAGKVRDDKLRSLLDKYLTEVTPNKGSPRWEKNTIERFKQESWADLSLTRLTTDVFADWKTRRLKTVKGSTFNRECNLLSNVFTYAVKEWRWMKDNPLSNLKRPPDEPPRDRTITDAERDLICLQLGNVGVSGKVRHAFLFALETGMRAGEVCRASVKDMQGNTLKTDGKTGKRVVSLSPQAKQILEEVGAFDLKSSQLDTAFRNARDAAAKIQPEIAEITFHATRHTAATRWAEKLNLLELCSMFGFKPEIAARVYVNLDAAKIAEKLR